MTIKLINNAINATEAQGHYSQAVIHNETIYLAGQIGINPLTQEKTVGSIEEQTRNILASTKAILIACNSDLNQIIRVTIYLSNMEHWQAVNQVYASVFKEHKPARSVIPVSQKFLFGFEVEMDIIAQVKKN